MLNGDGTEADYDTDGLPPDRRLAGSAKKPRCGDISLHDHMGHG